MLFTGSNPVYDIKSIEHCQFLPFHRCLSIVWDSSPIMHCVLWEVHCLFMLMDPESLFNGPDDVFFLLQMVPFKSHCSLPLADPNTLYIVFRYPLLSFSLNCSTIYCPLQSSSGVFISSWVSITYL